MRRQRTCCRRVLAFWGLGLAWLDMLSFRLALFLLTEERYEAAEDVPQASAAFWDCWMS